jgi:4-amino-4-deoxy-L-arabinose transferase-like glycosyltransferase
MLFHRKAWFRLIVPGLLIAQAALIVFAIHRESLTFDEEDHMYAGYRMWTAADYGLNPEHPPLVKLLAALPVLGQNFKTAPLMNIFFKGEAMMGGEQWMALNDDAPRRIIFRMRLATVLLALALSLLIFFATREWFGETAAIIALILAVFEPSLLAHSGLVTTDIGCALFFLAAVYSFYRYVKHPTWTRVLIAGIAAGLLLATKHSGILVGPILPLMAAYEVLVAPPDTRKRLALRLAGACAIIAVVSVAVLWSFYGFRFAARPAGLALIPSLANYAGDLKPFEKSIVLWIAHMRLLPESYIFGLVDIRVFAKNFNSFLLGRWYPHGMLLYFPVLILIKATLGLLAAVALTAFALVTGKLNIRFKRGDQVQLDRGRALTYVAIAGAVFLAVAIQNGLNIGVRHILPVFAVAVILAAAGLASLAARSRTWAWACVILLAAHVASSLSVYPNTIAYANEAWGGARNTHLYLSDSNVDWGQQLFQVKQWEDRHPGEECWFSYFVGGFVPNQMYGVHCHILPNSVMGIIPAGALETVPPVIHGAVLLSASEVDGGVWPIKEMNPYTRFQKLKPDEEIDYGILVYRGDISMSDASAMASALQAIRLLGAKQVQPALALAEQAVQAAPGNLYAQWILGSAAAAAGKKAEARAAFNRALEASVVMEPDRREEYDKSIQDELNKL